jgi:hypothetical protein
VFGAKISIFTKNLLMKHVLISALVMLAFMLPAQDTEKNEKEKPEKKEKAPRTVDPKYYYCYKDATLETDDYKMYIENPLADFKVSKMKVRIFNKTNDYLIFKPSEVLFKVNGQEIACKDKDLIIPPNDEASKTIDIKAENLQANTYTLDVKTLYKVASNVAPAKVEDLNITKNDLKKRNLPVEGFNCMIKKIDLETGKTVVITECIYTGEGIGILDPMKAIAIMPKGQENPNADKQKPVLLKKDRNSRSNESNSYYAQRTGKSKRG